jgi:hypothetical protein
MQQHTGVPPIITQQAQPAFMQFMTQSQHAWIMSQHVLSPLVQVRQHPVAVISHLHAHIVMLQQHTVMPFIVQQMLHIPPAIIAQRFCIMVQAAGSSHVQVIFIPPAHFSTFMAHRGTITMFGVIGAAAEPIGMFPIPAIAERSIIIAAVMFQFLLGVRDEGCGRAALRARPRDAFTFPAKRRTKSAKSCAIQLPSAKARLQFPQIRN